MGSLPFESLVQIDIILKKPIIEEGTLTHYVRGKTNEDGRGTLDLLLG